MADLTQNTAQVLVDTTSAPQIISGTAGEAINVGMPVYQTNASNGYWFQGNASNALMSGMQDRGIAYSSAAALGQNLAIFKFGRINLGGTLVAGQEYAFSINTGKVCNLADLATGQFPTELGKAVNTTFIQTPLGGVFNLNVAKG